MVFLHRTLLLTICLTAAMVAPRLFAAELLRVGVSFAIPPYVIEEEGRGIELDLFKEAFRDSGYEPHFEYLPLERTFRMLESGKLDAIINVKPGMLNNVFLSQPVIAFHNRVFTLGKTHISTLDDMKTLRVSAFQRARQILGGAFASMADQNPRYEEVAKQQGQVHRLMLGRVDAVILEQRVFYYYLAELADSKYGAELYASGRVRQYDLFAPTHYHFAFRQVELQRRFDRQLDAMRADGRYRKIFEAYGATP